MRQVKFIQIRNPLLLVLFVPFVLAFLALVSALFMGAGLLGLRRRSLPRQPQRNSVRSDAIEAEYKVVSESGLRDDQSK